MTAAALVTGAAAGALLGYVLHRGNLCFYAAWRGGLEGRPRLGLGWLSGVAVAAVGLSVVYALPGSDDLNRGLAFTPVGNIGGGLVIGVGMVVAASCASGLFVKLGSGMLGAALGIGGWALGELAVRNLDLRGPRVLDGGDGGTIPGVLGVPRAVVAIALLGVVVVARARRRRFDDAALESWQWDAPALGLALGGVTIAGWVLADLGGASFGPSTVGAVAGVAAGSPPWWLLTFLVCLVVGAWVAALTAGGLWVRGEPSHRYLGLAVGGFLLGAGGWIAGGCNLGHGLSGAAQLNVSSWVVVVAIVAGIALARSAAPALVGRRSRQRHQHPAKR